MRANDTRNQHFLTQAPPRDTPEILMLPYATFLFLPAAQAYGGSQDV
jgi:hypothetical protein